MPFSRIPPGALRRIAVPASVVTFIAWLPFALVGDPDQMVRLQLAGSESKAREIVTGWSQPETVDMAYLQGADALFPFANGVLLAVGAIWAGRLLRGRLAAWAPAFAWMAAAGGIFDLMENVGMIVMIRGDIDAPVPTITTMFAIAKFSMFIIVVPYIVAGLVARLRGRRAAAL